MSKHEWHEHWAAKYKNASRDSVEGWIYLAASVCRGTEDKIREIGRIAFETGYCVWHAAWIANGQKGECYCARCKPGIKFI